MVKGKGKKPKQESAKVRERAWPIVTSNVCETCPIQCPDGIAYMALMRSGKKFGRGVVCRKEMFVKRKAEGKHPFQEIPRLADPKTYATVPSSTR